MSAKAVHVLSGADWEIYVGRAMPRYGLLDSPWANPYKIRRDGERAEVLARYEEHVLESFGLDKIWLAFGYPSPVLACWCAPKDGTPLTPHDPEICHAQILLRLAGHTSDEDQ